jgi:hypothetical protein
MIFRRLCWKKKDKFSTHNAVKWSVLSGTVALGLTIAQSYSTFQTEDQRNTLIFYLVKIFLILSSVSQASIPILLWVNNGVLGMKSIRNIEKNWEQHASWSYSYFIGIFCNERIHVWNGMAEVTEFRRRSETNAMKWKFRKKILIIEWFGLHMGSI